MRLLLLLSLLVPAVAPAQDAPEVPVVDDGVLRLEDTPEIPDELRERLRRYLRIRWSAYRTLADDGSQMLINTRFEDTSQVHRLGMPMGAREQLTFFAEPIRNPRFWPGRTDRITFTADIGGNEQAQIWRMDLPGEPVLLTDGSSRHGAPVWNHAGDRFAYASTARNGVDFDVWVHDGSGPDGARLLVELDGYWRPGAWSPDDQRLLLRRYVSSTESHVWVYDVATGKQKQVSPKKPVAAYGSAAWGADSNTLFITSDQGGEFMQLFRVDLKKKRWTVLTEDIPWNVEAMAMSPDRDTLAFVVNEDGWQTLFLMDTASGERRRVDLPRGAIHGLGFARNAPVLGLGMSGPDRTGDAFSYDLRTGELTRWTQSETAGLDASTFVSPELVRVESFDGLQVPVWVYKPPGEGPFPVVIDIHGGPEAQSRPWFSGARQFQLLESGVAVVVPNVRGSRGYGKSYLKLDNGFLRKDSVKDIGAVLDWIATVPDLDEGRVAVQGGSYGGYMVLASLVDYSERLRAGVDTVGISNFVTFLENTKEYRRDVRRVEYGDERDPKMRAFQQEISPSNHADEIQSALMVGHGANDPRVPVGEAEQIVQAVRKSGRRAWYVLARNEGHGFAKMSNRETFTLLRELFYATFLIPEEPVAAE